MSKFICTASGTDSVSIGQVIYGIARGDSEFIVTRNTDDCLFNGAPKFKVGELLPLNGVLWCWREVKENDKVKATKFYQSEPKLQTNHFDGYATFIIAQACGMREDPQVHTIHMTEEQAREMAYEILEQLNRI